MIATMSLRIAIKERALEVGFDLVGVASLEAWNDLNFARHWVQRGYGGEMRYLSNPRRDDPRRVLPSVKSVICVGLVYNTDHPYSTKAGAEGIRGAESGVLNPEPEFRKPRAGAGGPRGWISRYAWGRDYHEVMRARLEQLRHAIESLAAGVETRVYVDTGPVVERAFARLSGIGWMGKNTCLINQTQGSWFFLGVILTSLEIEPDLPAPDRCGSCTRCLEACPTGALVEPYVMDASRCIAYFTIELKGSIPVEFRSKIGRNIFGCDICQDVCPWNFKSRGQGTGYREQRGKKEELKKRAATTSLPEFQPMEIRLQSQASCEAERTADDNHPTVAHRSPSLFNPPLEALATLTEEDFRQIFARSPIKRAKYRGWVRNLCVAMGNAGDSRFVPWLERAARHPDPIVREHAQWALEQLTSQFD
jgi:epoxyqueuosine reductase